MAGSIPFEESLNVQNLDEKDYVGVSWTLEDLNGEMINSRKLGIQAIVTLQVRVETVRDVEAAVDVKDQEEGAQLQKEKVTAAAIAVRVFPKPGSSQIMRNPPQAAYTPPLRPAGNRVV